MTYLNAADLGLRPGAEAKVADYPPGATFGPRTLRDFELVWLLHGSARWHGAEADDVLRLLIAQFIAGPPDPEPLPAPVLAAVDFLRTAWSRGLTPVPVSRLATAAAVSPAHLSRLFQATFGMGPAAALERIRLSRAADLLRRSSDNFPEVVATGAVPAATSPKLSQREPFQPQLPRSCRTGGRFDDYFPEVVATGVASMSGMTVRT